MLSLDRIGEGFEEPVDVRVGRIHLGGDESARAGRVFILIVDQPGGDRYAQFRYATSSGMSKR